MEDTLAIGALIGLFAPYVISFLKRAAWPVHLKMLLTLIVCLAGGAVTGAIQGDVHLSGDVIDHPDEVLAAASATFAAATVFYKTFVEGSGVEKALTDVKLLPGGP